MKYWRHETLLTLVLICAVLGGGMIGFIIGYTHAPIQKCRPEAISSTVMVDGSIYCAYEIARYGMARVVEK